MNAQEQAEEAERARVRAKIAKLSQSRFKQQTLSNWRPKATYCSNICTFMFFGALFLGMGGGIFHLSKQTWELVQRYDDVCASVLQAKGKTCEVPLGEDSEIDDTVKAPVYVYYQLNNYFQNHRRYVKSRDYRQFLGEYKPVDRLGDCDPIIKVGDLYPNQQVSVSGKKLDPGLPAIPCGLIAKSVFNDTFQLMRDGKEVVISNQNIAWKSDIEHKFANIKDSGGKGKWQDIQWIDMTDEHFIVWMRTAGLPTFRKLWGIIDTDLEPGKYSWKINNNYEVRPFKGKKSVVIATANFLGGRNYFLAFSFIVVGGMSMAFAFLLCLCSLGRRSA